MDLESLCVVAKVVGMEKKCKIILEKPDEDKGIIIGILTNEENKKCIDKILEYLNMLTDDDLGTTSTGNTYEKYSYVTIKEEHEIKDRPLGTELIRRLIRQKDHTIQQKKHNKTVKIEVVPRFSIGSYTDPESLKNARNKSGTNATIKINMEKEFEVPTTNSGGYLEMKSIPYHIALAHELIHAYHMVNGISKGRKKYHTYEYIDETGQSQSKREEKPVDIEELCTIGLTDEYKNEDLTENKIRDEQNKTREEQQEKLNERIAYWSND